jgi:microcystin-dependent protein
MLPGLDAEPLRRPTRGQKKRAIAAGLTGEIKMWPLATAPEGHLVCDGSAYSRKTYAPLFAVIGTTFGVGDGSTTFNVPNYVNRMPIGSGGLYALAATGGSKDAVVVAHTHTTSGNTSSDGAHVHTANYKNAGAVGAGDAFLRATDVDAASSVFIGSEGAHTHTTTGTAASTGVSGTNANLPPYLGIAFVIKT